MRRAALAVSEDKVHEAVLGWLRLVLVDALVYHTPNEGVRSPAYAARMKRLGLLPGVFDLTLLLPEGRSAYLEVKRPGETLSGDQRAFGAALDRLGVPWAVVRGIDDARAAVARMGLSTREAA